MFSRGYGRGLQSCVRSLKCTETAYAVPRVLCHFREGTEQADTPTCCTKARETSGIFLNISDASAVFFLNVHSVCAHVFLILWLSACVCAVRVCLDNKTSLSYSCFPHVRCMVDWPVNNAVLTYIGCILLAQAHPLTVLQYLTAIYVIHAQRLENQLLLCSSAARGM